MMHYLCEPVDGLAAGGALNNDAVLNHVIGGVQQGNQSLNVRPASHNNCLLHLLLCKQTPFPSHASEWIV